MNHFDVDAVMAQVAKLVAAEQLRTTGVPQPRPMPERVLLTAEEAAHRLRIGRTLMYQLIRTGEVETVLIGRLRRVPVSAVDEYAQRLVAEQSRRNVA